MTNLHVSFAAILVAGFAMDPAAGFAQDGQKLQKVASFQHQVTGVTVTIDGRIFVNFPRWTEDSPVSVAE